VTVKANGILSEARFASLPLSEQTLTVRGAARRGAARARARDAPQMPCDGCPAAAQPNAR
jgi:hypothetical protein